MLRLHKVNADWIINFVFFHRIVALHLNSNLNFNFSDHRRWLFYEIESDPEPIPQRYDHDLDHIVVLVFPIRHYERLNNDSKFEKRNRIQWIDFVTNEFSRMNVK